jgi:Outer membrane protein Omp28
MKTIKKYLPAVLLIISIVSCDKIEGPRKEEDNSGVNIGDNAVVIEGDTLVVADDPSPAVQRVMIEEFTGHLCGSCPPAAIILNDSLRALFGDKLVVVSVHSGHFADVCPGGLDCIGTPSGSFGDDYTSIVGDAIHDEFGFISYPMAMINRVDYPGSHKKTSLSWKGFAQTELNALPKARMNSEIVYDSTSREVKAAVRVELLSPYSGNLKLQMIIVEDSIIGWQQWYGHIPQFVPDYLFHDVLRSSMNGDFGQPLNTDASIDAGEKFIQGYFSTLDPTWNAEHCKLVAYIYDESTYKVVQVIESEIVE